MWGALDEDENLSFLKYRVQCAILKHRWLTTYTFLSHSFTFLYPYISLFIFLW